MLCNRFLLYSVSLYCDKSGSRCPDIGYELLKVAHVAILSKLMAKFHCQAGGKMFVF